MTGLILSALAVFVAGHGDNVYNEQAYEKAQTVLEKYYTGRKCNGLVWMVGEAVVYECGDETEQRQDDFYLTVDLKKQTWERYRKTQLLRLYITSNYPNGL